MSTTQIRLAFQDGCAVAFAFSAHPRIGLRVSPHPALELDVGTVVYGNVVEYDGPYEVTPSEEAQVLETAGRTLSRAVAVNPIPSNYGLITYNGSTITVS